MKKTVLFFILSFICLKNYCQVIYGTVFDDSTRKQIPYANVFFNGSSVGTITDKFGNFKLMLPENQKLPIAISYLGYESVLVSNYQLGNPLQIFLSPKVYILNDVYVYSKLTAKERKYRQQKLEIFKEQFLGTSIYARNCKILNENDIILKYYDFSDLLTAFSPKPLIIENKALGYQIIYYLDIFECSPKLSTVTYVGYYLFKEDQTLKGLKRSIVEKKRHLAYTGSRMEFFRSLWNNRVDSAGFTVKNSDNKKLSYENLVVQTDSNIKYWKYKGVAKIYHYSKSIETTIQVEKDSVYFDKLGYYDPLGINWWRRGEMTNQRMGDQLPFNYKYEQKNH